MAKRLYTFYLRVLQKEERFILGAEKNCQWSCSTHPVIEYKGRVYT